jgi:hypothetical protein
LLAGNRVQLAVALVATIVAAGTTLSAHRRDEYLQAARIGIEPRRVELQLDLTPGIDVAERIIADLDRDRNGVFSAGEQRAYVARVLDALDLRVDRQAPLRLEPFSSSFPDLDAMRRGDGTIRIHAAALLSGISPGAHRLAFRNAYRGDVSVYLANALVPDGDRVAITAQTRDPEQRELTIDYAIRGGAPALALVWLLAGGGMVVCAMAKWLNG